MNHRLIPVLFASALALAACGGSSDDDAGTAPSAAEESSGASTADDTSVTTPASPDTTTPATTNPAATTVPTAVPESSGVEETSADIIVESLDDMPPECVELMADFLVLIEPVVKDIDWNTATSNDFQAIAADLDDEFSELDTQTAAAGCDAYDFGDDANSLAAMLELAEEKAPGVTSWLQFIGTLTTEVSGTTDGPATCDEAIGYVEDLIADTPSMGDVPMNKMAELGQAMTVISADCDPQQSGDFYGRVDVTEFMSG